MQDDIKSKITNSKIFAIGEMHGVKENAQLYMKLFEEFGFEALALEFPQSIQEPLEGYLSDSIDGIEHYSLEHPTDGRVNLEYLDFIKTLWNKKLIKKLIYFDAEKSFKTWNERDKSYAEEFLKEYDPNLKTLLIAGNYHTKTKPFNSEFEEGELIPMCFYIQQQRSELLTAKIIYHSGQFYNFGIKNFVKISTTKSKDYWEVNEAGELEFHILNATPANLKTK